MTDTATRHAGTAATTTSPSGSLPAHLRAALMLHSPFAPMTAVYVDAFITDSQQVPAWSPARWSRRPTSGRSRL